MNVFLKSRMSVLLCAAFLLGCQNNKTTVADQSIESQPTSLKERSRRAAGVNIRLSVGYLEQGDMSRAKIKIMKAMELAPHWAAVHSAYGYFLAKTGDIPEAEKAYRYSLILAPREGEILNNYGVFLCQQKRFADSLDYFERAVKDPKYLETGSAYENAGSCAESISLEKSYNYFQKAVEHDPERMMSWYHLADLAIRQQSWTKATYFIRQYERLGGESSLVHALNQRLPHQ